MHVVIQDFTKLLDNYRECIVIEKYRFLYLVSILGSLNTKSGFTTFIYTSMPFYPARACEPLNLF